MDCPKTLGPLCCVAGHEGHAYGHVYQSTSGVAHAVKEEM